MGYGIPTYIERTRDVSPLVQGQEVTVVTHLDPMRMSGGTRREHAWVRSCPTIIGGVYTLRTSSGQAIMRLRHEIEA
jgi:hypothetical protein